MTRILLAVVVFAASLFCADVRAGAVVLSFVPNLVDDVPAGGHSFDLSLMASGFGPGLSLGGFDLLIAFNPAVLHFEGVTFGSQLHLSGLGSYQSTTQFPSAVEIAEVSFDDAEALIDLQLDTFTLATFQFTTTSLPGISDLTIVNSRQFPALLVDAFGVGIDDFVLGTGRVNTTPIPSTWLLACLGLGLLGLQHTRRASRRCPVATGS